MTVKLLKDGRIEVKDPHDALLLSLAGIELREYHGYGTEGCIEYPWKFKNAQWFYNNSAYRLLCVVYVPADVAMGLVFLGINGKPHWLATGNDKVEGSLGLLGWGDLIISLRRHNDRWNLLPEIEIEMEK